MISKAVTLALLGSVVSADILVQTATVNVNPAQTFQEVDGFGISEAFGHAAVIQGLPGAISSAILDFLFSNENGAGLTIIRNDITQPEVEPNDPGSPSAKPQYVWDYNDDGQVYVTQQAMARGLTTVYADAWSAPSFMKTNNNTNYGGYLCGESGTNCTSGDWRHAYAEYLVQYIKDYQEAGININLIGFINEPEENVSYSSMLLDNGQQAADFLEVFAPVLKKSGYNTGISCCDAAGWEYQRYLLSGIQAAGAEKYLSVVTSHGYITPPGAPFDTTKKVWETEWADLSQPEGVNSTQAPWYLNGGTAEALTWANHIQQAFTVSNVSAFLGWVGTTGAFYSNDAFIAIEGDEYIVSPRLWAFAQYSRFVKPGAYRVYANTTSSVLATTAFMNKDGSVAVQVINNSDKKVNVQIQGVFAPKGTKSIDTYLSNNAHNLTQGRATAVGDEGFEGTVPARSLLSFVVPTK